MRAAVDKISNRYVSRSSVVFGTKNAWAKWARRRYPNNGLKGLMAEFDLTEGEARGLLYAQASQPTIDKMLDHRRGGFGLGLEILCIRTGTTLEQYVEAQAREAANEARSWDAEQRRLDAIQTSLRARSAGLRVVDGSSDEPVRPARSDASAMGGKQAEGAE